MSNASKIIQYGEQIIRDNSFNINYSKSDLNTDFISQSQYHDREIETKNSNIFRYKFTEEIILEIHKFTKIHQFDKRNDFKDAWNNWIIENDSIISKEVQRLIDLGYEGDVIDKMYKSARYYFRKKSTEKKEPSKRRNYIGLQKELLESMDNHIKNNINNEDYKPSIGFDNFCKENLNLLKIEINKLIHFNITDTQEIKNKIKKTYKNRYFMIINK
jgi:hypothetical protein